MPLIQYLIRSGYWPLVSEITSEVDDDEELLHLMDVTAKCAEHICATLELLSHLRHRV